VRALFFITNKRTRKMSLLAETKRVLLKKETGIVSFINEEGHSTHVLYIQKPHMVKDEDFKEIMEALEIKFKKKS
jgi:hypothetical protein